MATWPSSNRQMFLWKHLILLIFISYFSLPTISLGTVVHNSSRSCVCYLFAEPQLTHTYHLFGDFIYTMIPMTPIFYNSSVQSLSCVQLFATPWIAALQASLSITISQSSLKLMSIKSVMPSSPLILCRPLLLLPPIHPSIWVFSNESTLYMGWPKYWSFSFSIIPSTA